MNETIKVEEIGTPIAAKSKTLGIRHNKSFTQISKHVAKSSSTLDESSPSTPFSKNGPSQSKSTGRIPSYRLSLSGKFINKRKRLEFSEHSKTLKNAGAVAEHEIIDESKIQKTEGATYKSETTSPKDDNHKAKVNELKILIDVWKKGFHTALEDLSMIYNPPKDKNEILSILQIPHEMVSLE